MLINQGGVYDVFSVSSGQINKIDVDPGDIIKIGDTIAILDQPEIDEQLKNQRAELSELTLKYSELTKLGEKGYKLQQKYLKQKYNDLQNAIYRSTKQIKFYKEKFNNSY